VYTEKANIHSGILLRKLMDQAALWQDQVQRYPRLVNNLKINS